MTHLTTISGKQFDFALPTFYLPDIIHALGRIQRYNGHTHEPWTVLQHSIACAYVAENLRWKNTVLEALLHDACEAYLCDIPTPLKQLLPDYQRIEAHCERAMRAHFDLSDLMTMEVKIIDRAVFVAEAWLFHPELYKEMGKPTAADNSATTKLVLDAVVRVSNIEDSALPEEFMAIFDRYTS